MPTYKLVAFVLSHTTAHLTTKNQQEQNRSRLKFHWGAAAAAAAAGALEAVAGLSVCVLH